MPLCSLDCMITVISCCRSFLQDRALPSALDNVVAKLFKELQKQRLPGNIEVRELSRIATVFTCVAFSDECCKGPIRVCKELLYKGISVALVYFTSATLYKAPLDEASCTGLFALCTCLLSREMQSFDSYPTDFYNAVFAPLAEVKSAAAAVDCLLREVFMIQVLVSGSKEMKTIKQSAAVALRTFH